MKGYALADHSRFVIKTGGPIHSDYIQDEVAAVDGLEVVPTILEVVCRSTGMGFAAVARVTEDRWIACKVRDGIQFGLRSGDELNVYTTICNDIRQSRELVVISDVAADDAYREHPTPAMYGFQSYISVPIVLVDGRFFGTLCAIDPRPARLDKPETIGMFKLFAELIAFHLNAMERANASEIRLLGERNTSELREQFIAVLGHDLRNPLAAIGASAEVLLRTPLDVRATRVVGLIRATVTRMSGLIDNVMDFARGRLGGGLTLDRNADLPLAPMLRQVIAELRAVWPGRAIRTQFVIDQPVVCDHQRVGQLFSNILGNALTYGEAEQPIRVHATTAAGMFELTVANGGAPIPRAVLDNLFQPFFRGTVGRNQEGLGLGLYIASEIARAHGGTLEAESSAEETRLIFRMPLAGVAERPGG